VTPEGGGRQNRVEVGQKSAKKARWVNRRFTRHASCLGQAAARKRTGQAESNQRTMTALGDVREVELPAEPLPPCGKYRPFAKLGSGGQADVFLAVARGPMGFNKLVVVKRLREHVAAESELLDMFLDEARLSARLSHPNI